MSRSDDRPRLRRALAQHHLRDGAVCRPLIEHLRLAPGAQVVEIGPGGGVLTRELLVRNASVAALELDPAWGFELRSRARAGGWSDVSPAGTHSGSRLSIAVVDALTVDWSRLGPAARVAGNLPYNVGTVVVERLLRGAPPGVRAAFLLQREVVDRAVARPGDDAYGALSVLVASRARAVRLGIVRPGAFVPPPRVASAFLGLEIVAPPLDEAEMPRFEDLVRAAFGQRRKTLLNSLGAAFGRQTAARGLERAAIDPRRRAEELSLDEFVGLTRVFAR